MNVVLVLLAFPIETDQFLTKLPESPEAAFENSLSSLQLDDATFVLLKSDLEIICELIFLIFCIDCIRSTNKFYNSKNLMDKVKTVIRLAVQFSVLHTIKTCNVVSFNVIFFCSFKIHSIT